MQIFIEAIEKSRVGKPEYILAKSLDVVRTNDEKKVLKFLKNGYTPKGKFVNGVGEYNYRLDEPKYISVAKKYIENELLGFEVIEKVDFIIFDFQEFFESITCKSEELKLTIYFWNVENGKPEIVRFKGIKAKEMRDFLIFGCGNVKQDGNSLMRLLERKIARGDSF